MSTPLNALGIVLFANDRERLPNGTILFDSVEVDQTSNMEFRIRNRSDVAVTITNISLQLASEYTIVGESAFEFPITLEPEDEFEFEINVFSELEDDELFDFLKIESSVPGAPLDFRLQTDFVESTGSEPAAEPGGGGASAFAFIVVGGPLLEQASQGLVELDETVNGALATAGFSSDDYAFYLINTGSESMTITSIVVQDGNANFVLNIDPAPVTLAPGEETFFSVTFTPPVTPDVYNALVMINHSGAESPFIFLISTTVQPSD